MNLKGQICLVRALADHAIWQGDLALRGAWVDLLLRANTEDALILQRGEAVEVRRGQLAWSVKGLADKWLCCEEKAAKYLAWFAKTGCIRVESTKRRTLITILNYDIYQTDTVPGSDTDTVPGLGSNSAGVGGQTLDMDVADDVEPSRLSVKPSSAMPSVPGSDTGSVTGSVSESAQSREKRDRRHTPREGSSPEWAEVEAFAANAGVESAFARDWFERKVNSLTHGFETLREWRFDLLTYWRRFGEGRKPGENSGGGQARPTVARAKSLGAEIMDAENTRKRLVAQMSEHPCNELSVSYDPVSAEYPAWRDMLMTLRSVEGILRSIPKDAPEDWQRRLRKEAFQRELAQHPGNPESTAYDEEHCTEALRVEFIALRKEIV
jgi:hypothetical protein